MLAPAQGMGSQRAQQHSENPMWGTHWREKSLSTMTSTDTEIVSEPFFCSSTWARVRGAKP